MLKLMSAVALVTAFAAGPAFAAGAVSATLEKPVAAASSKIFDGVIVRCEASACVSTSSLESASPRTLCRKIAKAFGPVTAFTTPAGAVSADQLAACNK